jgi:iron uptake system EfeUOB component EfeO/EfeM
VKYRILFSFILIGGMFLGGCGGNDDAQEVKEVTPEEEAQPTTGDGKTKSDSPDDEENQDLSKGVEETTSSVEELTMTLTNAPDDAKKINEQGTMIEEKWDKIEKQVEEKYPDDYEDIEKSLYPLIAEAKKESPDSEKLKTLSEETKNKLNQFHEKINKQ